MTDTPPENERDRKIRQAYTVATQALREKHPEEFAELRVAAAKDLGIEWQPRPSREQKAQAELDRLLEENPELLARLAERVAEADSS